METLFGILLGIVGWARGERVVGRSEHTKEEESPYAGERGGAREEKRKESKGMKLWSAPGIIDYG